MNYDKLSASLAIAASTFETGGPLAGRLPQMAFAAEGGEIDDAGLAKEPTARVFVRVGDDTGDAALGELAELGVNIRARFGANLHTAIVPISRLGELTDRDDVVSVRASSRRYPTLDKVAEVIDLPALYSRESGTGEGVIIGIVDTGIDGTCNAFRGRVLRVWDQTLSGAGVSVSENGRELAGPNVADATDTHGHGTHVAGIAAGHDQDFPGIAPGADLVVVKTLFDDTSIADGVAYVFAIADSLGRPAVVNLSLGGHNDAHDGTDDLSRAITTCVGPGRIVCVAAGNEGDTDMHARTMVADGEHAIPVDVDQTKRPVVLNLWYPGNAAIEIAVEAPSGQRSEWQGPIAGGPFVRVHTLVDGDVTVATPATNVDNPDRNIMVTVNAPNGGSVIAAGQWKLHVRHASGEAADLHAWVVGTNATMLLPDPTTKIGAPGTSAGAITVGATVSRQRWTAGGQQWSNPWPVHTMAGFSSPGPLRDGAPKPDVSAPGTMVISQRSAFGTYKPQSLVDASHIAMQGTSMATPVVTGLVAIMLANDPSLGPADVRRRLQQSCIPVTGQGSPPDAVQGHGRVTAGTLQI